MVLAMKKPYLLTAAALACVLGLPILGQNIFSSETSSSAMSSRLNDLAPYAGAAAEAAEPAAATADKTSAVPAETTTADIIPSQKGLSVPSLEGNELPPLRITPDKPEVVLLDRDAVNILVGSDKHLRVVPDTNRSIILIPKQPGSTYFRALDFEGKVIMQRHVIVGAPEQNYIRIRRACVNGGKEGCKSYSIYHCTDMCHEVSVVDEAAKPSPELPNDAPSYQNNGQEQSTEGGSASGDILQ